MKFTKLLRNSETLQCGLIMYVYLRLPQWIIQLVLLYWKCKYQKLIWLWFFLPSLLSVLTSFHSDTEGACNTDVYLCSKNSCQLLKSKYHICHHSTHSKDSWLQKAFIRISSPGTDRKFYSNEQLSLYDLQITIIERLVDHPRQWTNTFH